MSIEFIQGDCLEIMRGYPDGKFDLVFGSPPYEDARTYGIDFRLKGQAWVDFMVERWREMSRICKGLIAMVVEGKTKAFQWTATPALLMADLHRAGIKLRKPPAFCRVGIPGSGGPDWLRNDYEFVVCSTLGKLPWSDNTAMGHPPKWAPGGEMSYRNSDGTRRNQWGHSGTGVSGSRMANGERQSGERPSHVIEKVGNFGHAGDGTVKGEHARDIPRKKTPSQTQRTNGEDGSLSYDPPTLANPGNLVECKVGGGLMGNRLCHENEAPFPESLAEFFIRSFCPPGGLCLDPFSGSGTTAAVCQQTGRNCVGIDIRESQIDLARRRTVSIQRELLP